MPLHCIGERGSPTEIDLEEDHLFSSIWQKCPDSILLQIFSHLDAQDLLTASLVCKGWLRVTDDEFLWKALMQKKWGIANKSLAPGKLSWQLEYKRLHYHSPIHLSETLKDHSDEVLHVSFSHSGDIFSTTSKDATLKVWEFGFPTKLRYTKDFKALLSWDFTQFSCFNQSDNLLLVSSVNIQDMFERRGFVAILSVSNGFPILRVVSMNPSQLFGAWLDESTFLGGCLEISLDRFATTVQIESYTVPALHADPEFSIEEGGGQSLFTFCSETASLIKFLTVANIPTLGDSQQEKTDSASFDPLPMPLGESKDGSQYSTEHGNEPLEEGIASDITFSSKQCNINTEPIFETGDVGEGISGGVDTNSQLMDCGDRSCDGGNRTVASDSQEFTKNLIFVTGEFAVALHQLGFKNVSPSILHANEHSVDSKGDNLGDDMSDQEDDHMVMNFVNNDIHMRPNRLSDLPDHRIDLYGHVTGLCLSADHRYLFLNCRPWIGKVDRTDPWATPDLSPSIEVRVIDLCTLQDTGVRYVGHKGFSPSTMCCFVFLDVSEDYVGSGSEDAKGYLWDRHYQTQLTTLDHDMGVVNAVAFNPKDQEYMVTVCDDNTVKIWRSKAHLKSCLYSSSSSTDDIESSEKT